MPNGPLDELPAVGSVLWYWGPMIGSRPIQVRLDTICIWIDKTRTQIDYSVTPVGTTRRIATRIEQLFPTEEAANAYGQATSARWLPRRQS